jgi:hypothetical protein
MKIKLLLGLLLGLGIASVAEAFIAENYTNYPIMISYDFHTIVCGKTRWGIYIKPGKYHYDLASCDLKWIEYHVNYDGTATASALSQPGNVWTAMGRTTKRVNAPQSVKFMTVVDEVTGEPKVVMHIQ